jgi:pimeloyl-ACP methyl ester carboxylesterase
VFRLDGEARLSWSMKEAVIDDCGHWIMEEQPARLLEDLEQFLRE